MNELLETVRDKQRKRLAHMDFVERRDPNGAHYVIVIDRDNDIGSMYDKSSRDWEWALQRARGK